MPGVRIPPPPPEPPAPLPSGSGAGTLFAANLPTFGEVAEWFKAHAWNACLRKRNVGSNPTLSANASSLRRHEFMSSLATYDREIRQAGNGATVFVRILLV